jgi:chaperonin GroEL (HSP60 family)
MPNEQILFRSVARAMTVSPSPGIRPKRPGGNLGARRLRQAAEKTSDMVGDGTSTPTSLAIAMFADEVRNVVAGQARSTSRAFLSP